MSGIASIPVMNKPSSLMEVGPNGNNLAVAARSAHPVDEMQRRAAVSNTSHLDHVRHIYGSGLAMVLATEQKIALQQDRMAAGLPSSQLYRDVVSGTDVQLDFTNYLSLPEYQPDITK